MVILHKWTATDRTYISKASVMVVKQHAAFFKEH